MNITVRIPDELAVRLAEEGGDLERRALEGFALAEYQAGRLTRFELRELLGIPTRFELDAFLKKRGVFEPCTIEDVQRDVETLKRLGV
jgi:hypothetical protein